MSPYSVAHSVLTTLESGFCRASRAQWIVEPIRSGKAAESLTETLYGPGGIGIFKIGELESLPFFGKIAVIALRSEDPMFFHLWHS